MTKINVSTNDDSQYNTVDGFLVLIYIFGVIPLLTMFVWNVLVVRFFDTITIGYGSAWVILIIRSFFFKTGNKPANMTPKEELEYTVKMYFTAGFVAIAVLIIGYANGYL